MTYKRPEKGLHGLCRRGLAGERIGIPLKDLLGLNQALFLLYFLAQAFSAARSSPIPGPTSEPPAASLRFQAFVLFVEGLHHATVECPRLSIIWVCPYYLVMTPHLLRGNTGRC